MFESGHQREERLEPCKGHKVLAFRWEKSTGQDGRQQVTQKANRSRKSKARLNLRLSLFTHASSRCAEHLPCAWPPFQVPGRAGTVPVL